MIEIKGLTKRFGKKPVVEDVSVKIEPGPLLRLSGRMVLVNLHFFLW